MHYLSDAWMQAAASVVDGAPAPVNDPLVIDQRVIDGPSWRVRLDAGGSQFRPLANDDGEPDITFEQSLDTARAVAQGTQSAHEAFLLGDIAFSGDIEALIAARAGLDWLAERLQPVMAETTWD